MMDEASSEGFRILVLDDINQGGGLTPNFSILDKFPIDIANDQKQVLQLVTEANKKKSNYAVIVLYLPVRECTSIIKKLEKLDSTIQILVVLEQHDESVSISKPRDNLLYIKKPLDVMMLLQAIFVLLSKWQLLKKKRDQGAQFDKDLRERTTQLIHQATHDALTKLPNRTMLLHELNRLIKTSKHHKKQFAVLFLDLDRFKNVNDSLTHVIGDKVLQQVTIRLQPLINKDDFICRVGGDEFVIMLSNIKDKTQVEDFAKNILLTIQEPLTIGTREISLTTSIGIALYPQDEQNAELLFRNADTAMYKAKERGPNSFKFYNKNLNHNALERLEFENQLFRGLKNNEFLLHYQPEIDLQTNQMIGVEALVRWHHPYKGLISPLDFIRTAEETGLILPIGEWVMKTACMQNKAWQDKNFPVVPIAVNVASLQFEQKNLVEIAKEALKETNLSPSFLEIEINENIIVRRTKFVESVRVLHEMGVKIALDDFGVGFTILNNLKQIPVDTIKIDKSYILNIGKNSGDEAIIRAIIAIGNSFYINVLAEGIETAEQLNFLKNEGCEAGQGFYFSKPLVANEFEKLFEIYGKYPKPYCK